MGKYTIQEYWPTDLKVAAGAVIRAKLERKWGKRNALTCEDNQTFKFCADRYMEADTAVRRAKDRFDDMYCDYQEAGEVLPR